MLLTFVTAFASLTSLDVLGIITLSGPPLFFTSYVDAYLPSPTVKSLSYPSASSLELTIGAPFLANARTGSSPLSLVFVLYPSVSFNKLSRSIEYSSSVPILNVMVPFSPGISTMFLRK